jgi:hypothetical protein
MGPRSVLARGYSLGFQQSKRIDQHCADFLEVIGRVVERHQIRAEGITLADRPIEVMLGLVAPDTMDAPRMPERAGEAAAVVAVIPDMLSPACAVAVKSSSPCRTSRVAALASVGSVERHGWGLDLY